MLIRRLLMMIKPSKHQASGLPACFCLCLFLCVALEASAGIQGAENNTNNNVNDEHTFTDDTIPSEFIDYLKNQWNPVLIEVNNGETFPAQLKQEGEQYLLQLSPLVLSGLIKGAPEQLTVALKQGLSTQKGEHNLLDLSSDAHSDVLATYHFDETRMTIALDIVPALFGKAAYNPQEGETVAYLGDSIAPNGSGTLSYTGHLNHHQTGTNYSLAVNNQTSFGEYHLDTGITSRASRQNREIRFQRLLLAKNYHGQHIKMGYLGHASSGFSFDHFSAQQTSSRHYLGLSWQSSRDTVRTSLVEQEADIPITLYLSQQTTVEVWREDELIHVQQHSAGVQNLDTGPLPGGIYDITLKLYQSGRLVDSQIHTLYKSHLFQQESSFRLAAGIARKDLGGKMNRQKNAPWLAGYWYTRLPMAWVGGVGAEVIGRQGKLFLQLDRGFKVGTWRNGIMLGDNRRFNVRSQFNGNIGQFAFYSAYSLGRERENSSVSKTETDYTFQQLTSGLFRRLSDGGSLGLTLSANRNEGKAQRLVVTDQGSYYQSFQGQMSSYRTTLKYSQPFRLEQGVSGSFYVQGTHSDSRSNDTHKTDNAITVGVSLNFDVGGTGDSTGNSTRQFTADAQQVTTGDYFANAGVSQEFEGNLNRASATVSESQSARSIQLNGNYKNGYMTGNGNLHGNYDKQNNRFTTGATLNMQGGLGYSEGHAVAHAAPGQAGTIIAVSGLEKDDEIEVNNTPIRSNGEHFIPLPLFREPRLSVRLTGDTRYNYNLQEYDNLPLGGQYRGNVRYLPIELHRAVEVFAQIVDDQQQPATDAVVENHVGLSATDGKGFFVMPVSVREPFATVTRKDGSQCRIDIPDMDQADELIMAGQLVCKPIPESEQPTATCQPDHRARLSQRSSRKGG